MDKEIWKKIKSFETYSISSHGRIRNDKTSKIIKQHKNSGGYLGVGLYCDGIRKTINTHQLVAVAFLGHNIDGMKLVIDHIDGDRFNNYIGNLQITTNRHNTAKSKDKTKTYSKYTGVTWSKSLNKWQSQIRINKKQVYLGVFDCELEAAKAYQEKLQEL